MTIGSVEPMKKLHDVFGQQVQFVDILIRQAHPGPAEPPYRSFDEKLANAQSYRERERISWPVLVDDLQGSVHQVYGGLADPTYLIDSDGRVAFYNMWTSPKVLYRAIEDLLEQDGRGVVRGGIDRRPYMGPSMTDGWRGLARGWPQSFTDLMLAAPGMPVAVWAGSKLRPVLAPVTLRAKPLPAGLKLALAFGGLAVAAAIGRRALARRRSIS